MVEYLCGKCGKLSYSAATDAKECPYCGGSVSVTLDQAAKQLFESGLMAAALLEGVYVVNEKVWGPKGPPLKGTLQITITPDGRITLAGEWTDAHIVRLYKLIQLNILAAMTPDILEAAAVVMTDLMEPAVPTASH